MNTTHPIAKRISFERGAYKIIIIPLHEFFFFILSPSLLTTYIIRFVSEKFRLKVRHWRDFVAQQTKTITNTASNNHSLRLRRRIIDSTQLEYNVGTICLHTLYNLLYVASYNRRAYVNVARNTNFVRDLAFSSKRR